MSAELVLGPLLRYCDRTTACVWVETSAPTEVTVHGRTAATFTVDGHHYGYVVIDGLWPGFDEPYSVQLDGAQVWPAAEDRRPPPRLRTLREDGRLDILFGSCRTDRPHVRPWTLTPAEHQDGVGVDALHALSLSVQEGGRRLPDLLLHLGDQVYADEGLSPNVRERQVQRRGADSEPVQEVADFEEYTWLYHDSWGDPEVRWLLATVSSAMIFDDHDVRDDWNTSAAWREQMRHLPWWPGRIVGAYMSYWIYQHLGNLSPAQVEQEGVLRGVCRDGGNALRQYAKLADDEIDGGTLVRWSYSRDLGPVRLVVIDTRSGRVLDEQGRQMVSDDEWALLRDALCGDVDHLLIASSLPIVLERSLHDLERWDAALAAGAWGPRGSRLGERVRQAADLEHWAAFPDSFHRLLGRLGEVARGVHGAAPATVLMLSGDVHHSYLAPVSYPDPVQSRVLQIVSSPLRNAVPRSVQRGFAVAASAPARVLGRLLARSVGIGRPEVDWHLSHGPFPGNGVGLLQLRGRAAELTLLQALLDGERPALQPRLQLRLDAPSQRTGTT